MTRSIRKAHAFGKLDARRARSCFANCDAVSIDGYHNEAYWKGHDAVVLARMKNEDVSLDDLTLMYEDA
jgi:hypothetical protein